MTLRARAPRRVLPLMHKQIEVGRWNFVKSSFVPERGQRQLRDLTRHRAQLQGEHTRCANRIHKVLEDANVKLSSVATDILGKSGRDMLAALVAGEDDPAAMRA